MVEFKVGDLVEHKKSGRQGIVIKDDQVYFPGCKSVHFRDDVIEAVSESNLLPKEKPPQDLLALWIGDLVYNSLYNRYATVEGFRYDEHSSVRVRWGKEVYETGYWDGQELIIVEKAKKPTSPEPKFQVGDTVRHRDYPSVTAVVCTVQDDYLTIIQRGEPRIEYGVYAFDYEVVPPEKPNPPEPEFRVGNRVVYRSHYFAGTVTSVEIVGFGVGYVVNWDDNRGLAVPVLVRESSLKAL